MNNWLENLQKNPQKLIKCNIKLVKDWRKDLDNIPHGIIRGMLFSGDRFSCCDEAAVLYDFDGNFIGIATISFKGEDYSGKPEIVGLYVSPQHRNQGYGIELLRQALLRCFDVANRAQVVAISANVRSLVEKLPESIRAKVDFVDCSLGLNLLD
jgi:RimJ/RimL family protein N-acetyltransferase